MSLHQEQYVLFQFALADALMYTSGDMYGISWQHNSGGIVPFANDPEILCYAPTVLSPFEGSTFGRKYHVNIWFESDIV